MDRGKNNYNNGYNKNNSFAEVKADYDFSVIKNGYTDEKNNIKEEFMLGEAEKLAVYLAGDKRDGVSNSQLRQFYGEVKALQSRLDNNKENFSKVYPFILMLKSKANYKSNRKQSSIPRSLLMFIDKNIEVIQRLNKEGKGFEAFNNFALFFEVVVGYFKGVKD